MWIIDKGIYFVACSLLWELSNNSRLVAVSLKNSASTIATAYVCVCSQRIAGISIYLNIRITHSNNLNVFIFGLYFSGSLSRVNTFDANKKKSMLFDIWYLHFRQLYAALINCAAQAVMRINYFTFNHAISWKH